MKKKPTEAKTRRCAMNWGPIDAANKKLVAQAIREARARTGFSMPEYAKKHKITLRHLRYLENGERWPSTDLLLELIPLDEFIRYIRARTKKLACACNKTPKK